MDLPAPLQSLSDWIQAHVLTSPELAGLGLAAAIGLTIALVTLSTGGIMRLFATAGSAISAGARARKDAPGYRVIMAPPTGRSSGPAFRFLARAISGHMPGFSFDAPFQLSHTAKIKGGQTSDGIRAARARLKRSDADMIVWSERASGKIDGLRVFTLSRAGGLVAEDAVLDTFYLPGSAKQRPEALEPVAAYMLAKRLQPSLGRPEDFRAERLEPVAIMLEKLLTVSEECDPDLRQELETDFSSAALHIGAAQGSENWLDKVVDLRTDSLERFGPTPQPGMWAQAKFDLGRAMVARAEKVHNAQEIVQGGEHIRDAIDMFKTDPAIRRAEKAIAAFDKARNLLETRNRFSINFNG